MKDIKKMTAEELGTEIMACKNAEKGLKARVEELVAEAVARGYAGKDIPTVGGEYVVNLSEDTQRKLNMDKACAVLGTSQVEEMLALKYEKVTLSLSDFGTMLTEAKKDAICDMVEATVKATVRKRK